MNIFQFINSICVKTNYVGSPIGQEIDLGDKKTTDALRFLETLATEAHTAGVNQQKAQPVSIGSALDALTNVNLGSDERYSGRTIRLAFTYALQCMLAPGVPVTIRDHHMQAISHSTLTNIVGDLLNSMGVATVRKGNNVITAVVK